MRFIEIQAKNIVLIRKDSIECMELNGKYINIMTSTNKFNIPSDSDEEAKILFNSIKKSLCMD